jgi:UDP-glucose 4-epimerase
VTRTLITGSAGFVGRHLVEACRERDHDVVACDLKQDWDCRDLFRSDDSRFDLVFHCAATVGGRVGIDENAAFLGANNFQLDGAMFEWALNARPGRVVYFSSAAAYPTALQAENPPWKLPHSDRWVGGQIRLEETHCPVGDFVTEPDESYGLVKIVGEKIADRVRKAGVPVTVVRPFSSYGFDQDEADYPFPAIIRRAARYEDPFIVWGDGTQTRDFIHVDDLVGALLALIDAEVDGPVNLGTGIGTTMDELATLCMEAAGYDAPIQHLLDKPTGVHYRVCDNTLLRQYYEPQITIQEGVRRALGAVCV